MSESAVLRNYGRVEEALIVCAALQYAGFDASIDNYNHATVNWLLVPALGGIPVRLPTSQLEDAKAYLREMVLWRFLRATYLKLRHPSPHKLESSSSS